MGYTNLNGKLAEAMQSLRGTFMEKGLAIQNEERRQEDIDNGNIAWNLSATTIAPTIDKMYRETLESNDPNMQNNFVGRVSEVIAGQLNGKGYNQEVLNQAQKYSQHLITNSVQQFGAYNAQKKKELAAYNNTLSFNTSVQIGQDAGNIDYDALARDYATDNPIKDRERLSAAAYQSVRNSKTPEEATKNYNAWRNTEISKSSSPTNNGQIEHQYNTSIATFANAINKQKTDRGVLIKKTLKTGNIAGGVNIMKEDNPAAAEYIESNYYINKGVDKINWLADKSNKFSNIKDPALRAYILDHAESIEKGITENSSVADESVQEAQGLDVTVVSQLDLVQYKKDDSGAQIPIIPMKVLEPQLQTRKQGWLDDNRGYWEINDHENLNNILTTAPNLTSRTFVDLVSKIQDYSPNGENGLLDGLKVISQDKIKIPTDHQKFLNYMLLEQNPNNKNTIAQEYWNYKENNKNATISDFLSNKKAQYTASLGEVNELKLDGQVNLDLTRYMPDNGVSRDYMKNKALLNNKYAGGDLDSKEKIYALAGYKLHPRGGVEDSGYFYPIEFKDENAFKTAMVKKFNSGDTFDLNIKKKILDNKIQIENHDHLNYQFYRIENEDKVYVKDETKSARLIVNINNVK
jgi:hypothetical protein